jgi:hypothetical protein
LKFKNFGNNGLFIQQQKQNEVVRCFVSEHDSKNVNVNAIQVDLGAIYDTTETMPLYVQL